MSSNIDWPARPGTLFLAKNAPGAFRRLHFGLPTPELDAISKSPLPSRVSPDELDRRKKEAEVLLSAASPHLEWVSTRLMGEKGVVYLVDQDAVVLWSAGAAPGLIEEASAVPGSNWSESFVGTNAAGGAISANEPVLALGHPQGAPSWRRYSALAIPLHGREGEVLGAVVATSPVGTEEGGRLASAAYAAFAFECRLWHQEAGVSAAGEPPVEAKRPEDEEKIFRRLLDFAPDATVLVDKCGAILHASSKCEAVLGYPPRELLGHPIELLLPGVLDADHENEGKTWRLYPTSCSTGIGMTCHARRRDGSEIPVEISLGPVEMREGQFIFASIREGTEKRELLRRLEFQVALNRALAEAHGDPDPISRVLETVVQGLGWDLGVLWLLDAADGRLRNAGIAVSGSLATSEGEHEALAPAIDEGMTLAQRVCKEAAPVFISNLDDDRDFAEPRTLLGTRFHSAYGLPVFSDTQRIGVLGFFSREEMSIDEATRRNLVHFAGQASRLVAACQAAERRAASESRLQLLLRQMPLAVWTIDLNLVVDYCAGKFYGQAGIHPVEVYQGKPLGEIFPPNHAALEIHRETLAGKSGRFDLERGEMSFACFVEPFRNGRGDIVGALGVAIDVTGLKRAQESSLHLTTELERQVTERTVELQAALRETDALSYSIAHDLRAPLRAIASGAQIILEEDGQLGKESREWAGRILEAANRMDALVLGLLEFNRFARQEIRVQAVDLDDVVQAAFSEMRSKIVEAGARILVDRPLPVVLGDPFALIQALEHLLSNSIKFVRAGVVPVIRICAEAPEAGTSKERGGRHFVRLCVKDNGIGIASMHRERLFGVFERLHGRESYPGTGIGLAITKRIVERMGGRVGMESEPEKGSTFYLDLPGA